MVGEESLVLDFGPSHIKSSGGGSGVPAPLKLCCFAGRTWRDRDRPRRDDDLPPSETAAARVVGEARSAAAPPEPPARALRAVSDPRRADFEVAEEEETAAEVEGGPPRAAEAHRAVVS